MAAEQSRNKVLGLLSNNCTVGGVRVLGRVLCVELDLLF
jgi:hypothetical protein